MILYILLAKSEGNGCIHHSVTSAKYLNVVFFCRIIEKFHANVDPGVLFDFTREFLDALM